MPSHFSFGKVLNKQILWKVRYHFRSMHHFCRSHYIEIVRDPFPGKNFKSYQPQHEIWAFQCLKKAWQTNAKKKKKPVLTPDFPLFVVTAKFILPQTSLLRLDAPGQDLISFSLNIVGTLGPIMIVLLSFYLQNVTCECLKENITHDLWIYLSLIKCSL